jgi:hypothetical protein
MNAKEEIKLLEYEMEVKKEHIKVLLENDNWKGYVYSIAENAIALLNAGAKAQVLKQYKGGLRHGK